MAQTMIMESDDLIDLSRKYDALLSDKRDSDDKIKEMLMKLIENEKLILKKDKQIESLCNSLKVRNKL